MFYRYVHKSGIMPVWFPSGTFTDYDTYLRSCTELVQRQRFEVKKKIGHSNSTRGDRRKVVCCCGGANRMKTYHTGMKIPGRKSTLTC